MSLTISSFVALKTTNSTIDAITKQVERVIMGLLASFLIALLLCTASFGEVICYENITILEKCGFAKAKKFCFDDEKGVIVAGDSYDGRGIDGSKKTIIPGFIDVQINGAFGADFTQDPGSVKKAAMRLPETGVVAFAPRKLA